MASDDEKQKADKVKLLMKIDEQKTRVCWACVVFFALFCVIAGGYLIERLMT